MKNPLIISFLACALALTAWLVFQESNDERSTANTTIPEESEKSPDKGLEAPESPREPTPQAQAARDSLQTTFCKERFVCDSDPYMPVSQQELAWMRRFGYPTKEELNRLQTMSIQALKSEASSGSLVAMTTLGSKLVERNDPEGKRWLHAAADRGSVYAYYGISEAEMNRKLGGGLIEAAAFLRVAYILGDHKAAPALYAFSERNKLSMRDMQSIDYRAAELYETYAKNRQPVPRPKELER